MMIGLHDADLIYRNKNVHESEKMAHMMVCYLNVDLNEWSLSPWSDCPLVSSYSPLSGTDTRKCFRTLATSDPDLGSVLKS